MSARTKVFLSIIAVCIVLLLVLKSEGACAEDYFYVRGGLGHNALHDAYHNQWYDSGSVGGTVGFGYTRQLTGGLYGDISYNHYSQPFVPTIDETTIDHVYLVLEYRWH